MTLFWLGLGWMGGMALAPAAGITAPQWAAVAGLGLLALIVFRARRPQRWLYVIFVTICLGAWRAEAARPQLDDRHVSRFNDFSRQVTLTGVVVGPPEVRDRYVALPVQAEWIRAGQEAPLATHGQVLVAAERYLEWSYGDRIEATGFLHTPPEDETFSYRQYLARQQIFSTLRSRRTLRLQTGQANKLYQWIYGLREHLHQTVLRLFPEPEAALLSGILLGIEGGISPQVEAAFNATSTTHIIAISGFNITIVAGLFLGLFSRVLGKRRAVLAAGAGIAVYTVLVGASPAVVRAAVMGGLGLLALQLGRRSFALASLAASAILMTAFDPAVLLDVGFQLSFAATLGLILYADPFQHGFQGWLKSRWALAPDRARAVAGPVGEYFLFTLAAQVTTLPLTVVYFNRLSLASVLANPAILPAQPAVMILGGAATLAGSVWLPAGRLLAWAAWPFSTYTIRAVSWFADWPGASLGLPHLSPLWALGFYGLLFGLTALAKLPPRPRLHWSAVPAGVSLAALGLTTFLVWSSVLHRPDGRLHLQVLDTHGGQAVLVISPSGRSALINGGLSPIGLGEALGRRLPPFQRDLDWLILASAQDTDLIGLSDLGQRFEVGNVLADEAAVQGPGSAMLSDLRLSGVPIYPLLLGAAADLGTRTQIEVLSLASGEAVLRISQDRARFLVLAGPQLEGLGASELARIGAVSAVILRQAADVSPMAAERISRLDPIVIVISAQPGDPTSLPSQALVEAFPGRILRTDAYGTLDLATDGARLWVTAERRPAGSP
jgi:competence protein ComEC